MPPTDWNQDTVGNPAWTQAVVGQSENAYVPDLGNAAEIQEQIDDLEAVNTAQNAVDAAYEARLDALELTYSVVTADITVLQDDVAALQTDVAALETDLATGLAGKQPLDATLTALAGTATSANKFIYFTAADTAAAADLTAFGRSIAAAADDAAARAVINLEPGIDVQGYDADLAAIAGLSTGADTAPYFTGAGAAALMTVTGFARTVLDDSDAATARTTLGLAIGSDVQAFDADLAALAGLTSAADRLPYFTGSGSAALATFTSFGRSLVDDADASAGRTTLGLGTAAVKNTSTSGNNVPLLDGANSWSALQIFTANPIIQLTASAQLSVRTGAGSTAALVLAEDNGSGTYWTRWQLQHTAADNFALARYKTSDGTFLDFPLIVSGGGSASGDATITVNGTFSLSVDLGVAHGGTGASTFTAGLLKGSGTTALSTVVIAGTGNEVTVTNGDGAAGNPTISLPSALTFTGKTVTGGTFTSPAAITGLPTPTASGDAATKGYVDSVAVGLQVKAAVACATTANITLSGEQTIDGVLTSASRVLVKNQTTTNQNGIYVSAAGAWSRATDMDAWSETVGAYVYVSAGTTQISSSWASQTASGGTLGTTAITFAKFGASTSYSAGTGLQLSGSTFSISDAELLALAGLSSAADKVPYFTGSGTAALADLTSTARSLLDDGSTSAMRTTLGLAIGLDVQAYDAQLAALAALSPGSDAMPYFTSSSTAALATVTAFARSVLDDADAATARTTLGLAIGSDVQAYDADLAALAALSSTGFAARTASETWAQRSVAGTSNEIAVTNGDGVAGNPTVSLPSALTLTGKTLTGGTFASPAAITGLPSPSSSGDAATKGYVDGLGASYQPLFVFLDRAAVQAATVPAARKTLACAFHTSANLVGGATYRRMSLASLGSYPSASYVRSTDRYMPDGSTDATNGGYWLIDDVEPDVTAFGAVPGASDTSAGVQAAINWANARGGGVIVVKTGSYTFTAAVNAKSRVTLRCEPGVTFTKNYYNTSNEAIFCNASFGTDVDDFCVEGFPILATSSLGGKLLFLKGARLRMFVRLGTWYAGGDSNADGFGVAVAGEAMHIEATGGDPQETNGTAGVQVYGGSGYVLCNGLTSGDDCLGLFPIQPGSSVGGITLHDIAAEVVNCTSKAARIVAIGIPTTSAHNAQTAEVKSCKVTVIGGQACETGENAAGTAAVGIQNNPNLPATQVSGNHIVAISVDANGQYGGRIIRAARCSINLVDPIGIQEHALVLNDTSRCAMTLRADLSGATSGQDVVSLTGVNTDFDLDYDVIAPPGSGAICALGNSASNTLTRGRIRAKVADLQSSQIALTLDQYCADVVVESVEARRKSGATSTVGIHILAGATRCRVAGGELSQVDTPVVNAAATTRIDRDQIYGLQTAAVEQYANTTDFTVYPRIDNPVIDLTGTMSASRALTISTTNAVDGDTFVIRRTGGNTGGPWTWTINSLVALYRYDWATFRYDAPAGAWILAETNVIVADRITYAQIQNVTATRILGRKDPVAGDVEELTSADLRTTFSVVTGPASVAGNEIAVFSGGTGKVLKAVDGVTIDSSARLRTVKLGVNATPNAAEQARIYAGDHVDTVDYAPDIDGDADVRRGLDLVFTSASIYRTTAGIVLSSTGKLRPMVDRAGTGFYNTLIENYVYGKDVEGSHVVLNMAARKKGKASVFVIDSISDEQLIWAARDDVTGLTNTEANLGGTGRDHATNADGLGKRNVTHYAARAIDSGDALATTYTAINKTTAQVTTTYGHRLVVDDLVFWEDETGLTAINADQSSQPHYGVGHTVTAIAQYATAKIDGITLSTEEGGTTVLQLDASAAWPSPGFQVGDWGKLSALEGPLGDLLNDLYFYVSAVDSIAKTVTLQKIKRNDLEDLDTYMFPAFDAQYVLAVAKGATTTITYTGLDRYSNGQTVTIRGEDNLSVDINGEHVISGVNTATNSFTIPVNTSAATGTYAANSAQVSGGSVVPASPTATFTTYNKFTIGTSISGYSGSSANNGKIFKAFEVGVAIWGKQADDEYATFRNFLAIDDMRTGSAYKNIAIRRAGILARTRAPAAIEIGSSPGYAIDMHSTDDPCTPRKAPIRLPGGGVIAGGAGAPGAMPDGTAYPNGSIYIRTDGAAATTLYVRASGAWSPLT